MNVADGATRRVHCARCLRPQRTCICRWIVPTDNDTEVLFLQHPLEVGHAKGSAQLLHQSLHRSRLAVGEQFDEAVLHALLYAPVPDAPAGSVVVPALLYPAEQDADAVPPDFSSRPNRLVVLDGTWRKSRKMLHLNPLLRQLPRISLNDLPPSRYRIRKAHRADQLSSYEATCHALAQLEQNSGRYAPLLQAFDGFVAQQASYGPAIDGADGETSTFHSDKQ